MEQKNYLSLPEDIKPEGWGTIQWIGFSRPPYPRPPNVHPLVEMMHELFPWTESPYKEYHERCRQYDILIDKIRNEFAYWESLGFDGKARFDTNFNLLQLTLIARHRGEILYQTQSWSWEILQSLDSLEVLRNDFRSIIEKISETDEVFRETIQARWMTAEESMTLQW